MTFTLSRRTFLAAGAGIATALLFGCSSDGGSSGGRLSLVLGKTTTNNFTHVPLLVALRNGFFASRNLEVSTVGLSSAALPTALLRGDIDCGYLGVAGTFMGLRQEGEDVVCVALATKHNPNIFVVSNNFIERSGVGPDAPLEQRFQALATARFAATDPGAGTDVTIRAVMESVGVDPDTLNITYLRDIGTFAGAMEQDNIDAFAVFSPVPEQIESAGVGQVYLALSTSRLEEFDEMAWTSVWMMAPVAAQKAEATGALVAGLGEALKMIAENPEQARDSIREDFADLSDEVFELAFENNRPIYPATPEMTAEGVQKAIDLNNRTASTPYLDPPATLFTNEYQS